MEIIGIIGTIIGLVSFVYAIKTNSEKKKLEELIQQSLQGLAGNIISIRDNADRADLILNEAQDTISLLENSDDRVKLQSLLNESSKRCMSTENMLGNLLNEVLTLQMGLFKTDKMLHPDMNKIASYNKKREIKK